ncbi:hypothetical protein [Pseudomonas sp. NFACC02]|uniref:hypothetical protein n=1 Tax=Pseudomonas sp. NFACC02 TaxID=1566250 RepID=UPI001113E178|nr:hypothetical protein [Pseudomonas sp. NFACC02]
MNTHGLSNEVFREAFNAYGRWLISKTGSQRASLLINRHFKAFQEMNALWRSLPSYGQLLESFGARWMRRAELPMRWMQEECGMQVDEELKADLTELRRIDAIIASMPSDAGREILANYRKHLEAQPNKRPNSLRSVRMALRSAANLMLVSASPEDITVLPSSKSLNALLAQTPGEAASLSGFVSFLNSTYAVEIKFPKDNREAIRLRRHRFEIELKLLMREAAQGGDVSDRWPAVALGYFHGVPRVAKSQLVLTQDLDQEGMQVSLKGKDYWIPLPTKARLL